MLEMLPPIRARPPHEECLVGATQQTHSQLPPLFSVEGPVLSPPYLHHEDVPLRGQKADLVLQLQHGPHQVHDIAVHRVICAVQVGSGGWVDGLPGNGDTTGLDGPKGHGGKDQHLW